MPEFLFPQPPVPFSLPYDGARLEWAIEVIGWNKNQFCQIMDMNHGSVRQMLTNKRHIPDTLGIWVETLAQFHLTFPKPLGWWPKPELPEENDSPGFIA